MNNIAKGALKKFSAMAEVYGREAYYKKFFNLLNQLLIKNYGDREAKKILEVISSNGIIIKNSELFFSTNEALYEPSVKPFDSQKDLNSFFCATLINCKRLLEEGTQVRLTWFLVHLSMIISYWKKKNKQKRKKESSQQLQALMDTFMASLCTHTTKCPFTIRIVDRYIFKTMCEEVGLTETMYTTYGTVLTTLFNAYDKLRETSGLAYKPRFEMLLSVYKDARKNQECYLASVFATLPPKIRKITNNITSLSKESIELDAALELLKANSNRSFIDLSSVKNKLRTIENKPWYVYNSYHLQNTDLNDGLGLPKSILSSHNTSYTYVALDNVRDIIHPALAEIEISCKTLSLNTLDIRIDMATKLCLLKYRESKKVVKSRGNTSKGVLRIVLKHVSPLNDDTLNYIKEKEKKIESLYNREVHIVAEFDEKECTTKFGNSYPTHINVISDIHADVNSNMGYYYDFGNDFVINCGDTSGDCQHTADWIKTNMQLGLFTMGNHLGYNQPFPELNGRDNMPKWGCNMHENNTANGQSKLLAKQFASGDVKYVANNCHEYQGIYFIGAPLFTDFCLYGREKQEDMMNYAKFRMNDYRNVKVFVECDFVKDDWDRKKIMKNQIITQEPLYQVLKHAKTMRFFTNKVRELHGKPVVLFTHHAPLPYSIADKYKNDPLSAAFASDLRPFLKKFSNIRLWCHGHVHAKFDYIYIRKCKDGTTSETRVVCNPFGYYTEYPDDPEKYGKRISIKDIKSVKKWTTILDKEIKEGKVKVYIDED